MKEVERTDRSSIFVSDGYISLALSSGGPSNRSS